MASYWTVQQGDYLSKIAFEFGFGDYKTIWDHPENKELKKSRKNPNVLLPGDLLFVPDLKEKEESRPTDQRHRFQRKSDKLMLRIVVKDMEDKSVTNRECELQVEGGSFPLRTNGNGQIEHEIPKTAQKGKLVFKNTQIPFIPEIPIKIGHLDPVDEVSGQIGRLNNLGYDAGEIDNPAGTSDEKRRRTEQLRSAIEEFQCDHGLNVDGKCGPKTQAKLKEIHGC